MFYAKEFRSSVEAALDKASGSLKWLAQAYCWSDRHLKEIHVVWPEFTTEWLENRVGCVFNVSIELYARMAGKFGGGDISKGFSTIDRFGYNECMRAERALPHSKMRVLAEEVNKSPELSRDDFRKKIEHLSGEVAKERRKSSEKRKKNVTIPDTIPESKTGCSEELLLENEVLRKENALLKRENKELKSKLKSIAMAIA